MRSEVGELQCDLFGVAAICLEKPNTQSVVKKSEVAKNCELGIQWIFS
jgi:hypothetical protein